MTWSEANKICTKEYDGQLGSIHSEDENNFIFELAFGNTAIQRASNMWMGGKRSTGNNFVWIDGTPFNYTNWGKQTVQQSGDGDCMEMWSPWYSNDRGVPSDSGEIFFVFQLIILIFKYLFAIFVIRLNSNKILIKINLEIHLFVFKELISYLNYFSNMNNFV
jgi:hypothetical protein